MSKVYRNASPVELADILKYYYLLDERELDPDELDPELLEEDPDELLPTEEPLDDELGV